MGVNDYMLVQQTFEFGHANEGKRSAPSRNAGHVVGSVRCLSPYPDETVRSQVSIRFQIGHSVLHVHGPIIWIDDSPIGVHQGRQTDK